MPLSDITSDSEMSKARKKPGRKLGSGKSGIKFFLKTIIDTERHDRWMEMNKAIAATRGSVVTPWPEVVTMAMDYFIESNPRAREALFAYRAQNKPSA